MYFQHYEARPYYTQHVTWDTIKMNPSLTADWVVVGQSAWPPRSPDLTHLDYCLWGHKKTLIYVTKVNSREALRDRIFAAVEHMRHHLGNIASADQSLLMRAENCIADGGGNFEQLLQTRYSILVELCSRLIP
jgi:hypothetical protein